MLRLISNQQSNFVQGKGNMATYTHNEIADPGNISVGPASVVSGSPTLIVVDNADGTFTRIHGTGFSVDASGSPNGGTVTSIDRTSDAAGTTVYETITGM